MSEHRELEHDLVELALGEVAEPRRSELLSHLSTCLRCRSTYAEVVAAIDATIPAAPEAQPPAGFDLRVLSALGIDSDGKTPGTGFRLDRLTSPRLLFAAAAVVVALAAGLVGGATMLGDSGSRQEAPTADNSVLKTSDGEQVGTTAVAWMHERRVLVLSVSQAPVGVRYRCRVVPAEGRPSVLGRWEASSPTGGTWVVPAPQGDLSRVQLVTDTGAVWSSARLP